MAGLPIFLNGAKKIVNVPSAFKRLNLAHASSLIAAVTVAAACFTVAFTDPQLGLDAGLLLAALSGLVYAVLRLIRLSGMLGRVTRAAVFLAGWPLAGFMLGVTSALGIIPLVLLPLVAAVGAGAVSLWLVRKTPRHLVDVGGFGRHMEAAVVVVAIALLTVAGSAVFDPDVFSLAASVTLIGGTGTAAVAAWGGVRMIRGARTLFDVTVTSGGTLSVLMLHGMFAVVPTVLAAWASGWGA